MLLRSIWLPCILRWARADNGGSCHASTTLLAKLDLAQNRFLPEVDLTGGQAFFQYNFAPPIPRRNIGVLDFLYKRVLGKRHPNFETFLPWHSHRISDQMGRGHTKQL